MQTLFLSVKFVILGFVVALLGACNSQSGEQNTQQKSAETPNEEKWIQLFNGKDLDDWQFKFTGHALGENYKNTFRVEDGLLRVSYDEWDTWDGSFGLLFYKTEFSNYRLRVEYRFVGEQLEGCPVWTFRNNGIMLHTQSPESMELDQRFPTCLEAQLRGGVRGMEGFDPCTTLNVCTPGTNVVIEGELTEEHTIYSNSETYYGEEWVTVEVEVHGGGIIRHYVNGQEVLQYEQAQLDPRDQNYEKLLPASGDKLLTKGSIALQSEGAPTDFRKIELMILDE